MAAALRAALDEGRQEAMGLLRSALEDVTAAQHHTHLSGGALLDQAREGLKASETGYQAGKVSLADWMTAAERVHELEAMRQDETSNYGGGNCGTGSRGGRAADGNFKQQRRPMNPLKTNIPEDWQSRAAAHGSCAVDRRRTRTAAGGLAAGRRIATCSMHTFVRNTAKAAWEVPGMRHGLHPGDERRCSGSHGDRGSRAEFSNSARTDCRRSA